MTMLIHMIQAEDFIYALFNGVGTKLIKSPNLNKVISPKDLQILCALYSDVEDTKKTWIPDTQMVAETYLTPAVDEHGRKGIWNHTILIPITDYLARTNLNLMKHFIHKLDKIPESLPSLQIE